MIEERLYRITTPRFCGGVVVLESKVVRAAPCYGWAVGKHINYVVWYCQKREWEIEEVK